MSGKFLLGGLPMKKPKKEYTIGEWVTNWLENYAQPSRKDSTMKIYRDALRRLYLEYPDVMQRRLTDLTALEFENMLNSLIDKYAKSTLRHMRILMNQSYKAAKKAGITFANPIQGTELPKNAREKEITPLTAEEQSVFEAHLSVLPLIDDYALRILLLTGLRRDELRLLQWSDWNQKNRILTIRTSKTVAGIRQLPLIPEVQSMLCILHVRSAHRPDDYIISQHDGNPVCKTHFRHICNKVARAAGLRHITPHMLRHTFATRLIEKGADPKSVSLLLGHTTVQFTLQHYVHPDFEYLQRQVYKISLQHRA